jgi:hypothetical protein
MSDRDPVYIFDVSGNGSATGLSSYRDARVPHQPRTRRHVPLRSAEIDPRTPGLQPRSRTRTAGHDTAGTDAHAKCPDWHDEGARIRGRLHVSAPVFVRTLALRRLARLPVFNAMISLGIPSRTSIYRQSSVERRSSTRREI